MYSGSIRKIKVCCLTILLLGLGIVGILLPNSEALAIDDGSDNIEEPTQARGAESRSTKIDGYIQLWDYYTYTAHDGIFGDDDGFDFYLGSEFNNFRIMLYNIDYVDYYLESVNTYLRPIAPADNAIKVTSPYYNLSYIDNYDYEYCFYNLEIRPNAVLKAYELALDINFYVYEASTYDYVYHSGTLYFKIQLSPRIKMSGTTNKFIISNIDKYGTTKPLYSGATNQLLSIQNVYSGSDTLEDVEFNLILPTTFSLESKTATVDQLTTSYYSNNYPIWRLKSAGEIGAKAQQVSGLCSISYKINDMSITESNVQTLLEITDTPIICLDSQIEESEIGSKDGNKLKANIELYQGTISKQFSLTFNNDGNIDLRDVEVELYTDNAQYFYNPNFYYDEGSNANKQPISNAIEFGDLKTGQSVTRSFTLRVIMNLPPGLYKIPIKYTALYDYDEIINAELTETNFHHNIMAQRSVNNKGFIPFILALVNEGDDKSDKSEPDMSATSSNSLRAGMQNVQLAVELMNLENYQLDKVNAFIDTGGLSPLQSLNKFSRSPKTISAQEKNFTIGRLDNSGYSNRYVVHFLVDIYSEATPGRYNVPITIICKDAFNNERTSIIKLPLVIDPILPNLIISDISTTDIVPNENFTLYVKVYNYGGSTAKNARLMFNGSSNLFSATESISEPQTIDENEEVSFEFDINAGEVEPGGSYISYILMCYEDIIENYYTFETNPVQTIPLYIKQEKEVMIEEMPDDGPKLIISSLTTTTIKPNTNFTLNFKLYNYGGDTAMNVIVMFNESSNLFSTNPSIQGPNIILKNAELEYVFVISAGDVELGKTYQSSILISYWDHAGNVHSFDTTEELAIDLKVKGNQEGILDQSKDLTEKETEPKDVGGKASNDFEISSGFALVILGIFILVSTIIFSTIHFKATNRDRYRQKSKSFEEEENRFNLKSGDDVNSKSLDVQRKSSVKPIVQSSPAIQKPQPRRSQVSQTYSHPSPTTKPNQSTGFTQSSQSVTKTPLLPAHTPATSPIPTITTPTPTITTPTPIPSVPSPVCVTTQTYNQ